MNVLIACEESQRVCYAFRSKGHNAFSCDVQKCGGSYPQWHINSDVLPLLNGMCEFHTQDGSIHKIHDKWDLIIAHPPCTHLSASGQWAYSKGKDVKLKEEAAAFFMRFVNCNCDRVCIENSVGVMSSLYRKPDQIIQPWQFGHPYTKSTCLWLKGLPLLRPNVQIKPENCKSYAYETNYDERGKSIRWNCELNRKIRSRTFEGIASAMAEQWG